MQMKADTYPILLHQVSSQLEQNRRGDVRSRIVPCDPPGHRRYFRIFLNKKMTYRGAANIASLSTTAVAARRASWRRNRATSTSVLKLHVARRELERKFEKVQENSETRFRTTYLVSTIALEHAGVDLEICTKSINSSTLEVACPPPGIRAKF